jgi:site-specific DNA recombinase
VRQLEDAQDSPADPDAEQARRDIADCDAKLRQHRAALEAGADPVLVTGWITETQAHRAAAQARLSPTSRPQRLTRDQITSIVSSMRDLITVLASADSADKADIYGQLGLELTYHPVERRVEVKARPAPMYVRKCPRGDLNPHALLGH